MTTAGGPAPVPMSASAGASGSAEPMQAPQVTAGTEAQPPMGTAGTTATVPTPPKQAMDECKDLNSGYPGDEYCILPPPADKGFQLHIGPTSYTSPDARYVLEPGQEMTNDFDAVSGNTAQIYFLYRQFRMRPGSHHMIITQTAQGATFGGRRIGTANTSLDSPVGGVIPPENQGVGIELPAQANLNVSLHSINVTNKPIVREIWVNFWYRDAEDVTETATQLFATGDVSFAIQPGEDTILGPYSCTIMGNGRMLWFYGHRHASNRRFSAWRVRGTQRDLFYEGLHWEEPLLLEYSTTVMNPVPNRAAGVEGGWTGVLDLKQGDKLEWECHVVNEQMNVLRFTNNTYTGEMCIMDAELVGATCPSGGGGLMPPGGDL